ncbi:MAG: Rab family GTPase [Candidatus Hodarchaeales archaeon]|jgi:small GTP-binding protein
MTPNNEMTVFKMDKEKKFKICIIGDAGTGKTCLLTRYMDGIFLENSRPTTGVNIKEKEEIITISSREGRRTGRHYSEQFEYWDLGGQKLFKQVREIYLKGSDGIILCFTLDDRGSFLSVPGHVDRSVGVFIREMMNVFGTKPLKEIPVLIVGTKNDLVKGNGVETKAINPQMVTNVSKKLREAGMNIVAYEKDSNEISVFAKHHQDFDRMWEVDKWKTSTNWIKTSSKTGQGVNDVFQIMKNVMFQVSTFQSEKILQETKTRTIIPPGVRAMASKSNKQARKKKDSEKEEKKSRAKRNLDRAW